MSVSGSKGAILKAFLAALYMEAVFCPVAPGWNDQSLSLQKGKESFWYSNGGGLTFLEGSFEPWGFLSKMKAPSLVLRTSASLSQGNWVGYEASNIEKQLKLHQQALFSKENLRLQLLPLYHTFGMVLDALLALYNSQSVLFIEVENLHTGHWLKWLPQAEWNIALTPRLAYMAARFVSSRGSLGLLHVGGAPLTRTCRELCENVFERVVEGYGLTECGPGVLLENRPLEGIELRLENIQGDVGVLWIKTPMLGCWQSQKGQLVGQWFCSQDLALQDNKGWKIVGRVDRFFKQTDGKWYSLDELEYHLSERFQLVAVKIKPSVGGGYIVQLLERDKEKTAKIISFIEEKTGLGSSLEILCEESLFQKTTKALL